MACLSVFRKGSTFTQICCRLTSKPLLCNNTSSSLQTPQILRLRLHTASQKLSKPAVKSKLKAKTKKANVSKPEEGRGIWLLCIPVITFGLGTWQIFRLRWKLDLIKEMEKLTKAEAVPLLENVHNLEEMEYRKVKVQGHFDHSMELYMKPRSLIMVDKYGQSINPGRSLSGVHVVTPFVVANSNIRILVDRGWVPLNKIDPETRKEGQIEGDVELGGVVRFSEKHPTVGIENDIAKNSWISRDVETMSRLVGAAPIFLDADAESSVPGGPIGGQTRVTLRNDHLSYIITWYILCIVTSYMWYSRFIAKVR